MDILESILASVKEALAAAETFFCLLQFKDCRDTYYGVDPSLVGLFRTEEESIKAGRSLTGSEPRRDHDEIVFAGEWPVVGCFTQREHLRVRKLTRSEVLHFFPGGD